MACEGEVQAAAKAICRAQFGDETVHGDARCCQVGGNDGCCLQDLVPVAVQALQAAEIFRAGEARRNCRHPNKRGHAMISSDGSGSGTWHCADCGEVSEWTRGPSAPGEPRPFQNIQS